MSRLKTRIEKLARSIDPPVNRNMVSWGDIVAAGAFGDKAASRRLDRSPAFHRFVASLEQGPNHQKFCEMLAKDPSLHDRISRLEPHLPEDESGDAASENG